MGCVKFAFSGTHGTGKTTSALEFTYKLKLNSPNQSIVFLSEVASQCPLPINSSRTIESQMWIFSYQLCKECEWQNKCDILVCDRPVYDTIAYMSLVSPSIANSMKSLCEQRFENSEYIRFKRLSNNDHLYDDGIRDVGDEYNRKYIDNYLAEMYSEWGSKYSQFVYTEI